ncbi:hypothetical protein EVAR_38343_1 [Eumeta japonica]|uniref:Uncharacterized protein n=1 Tax=Eumeta variegata TaxID=151549 RepID=A0A4C1X3H6_EUMVA|nr:hypothetical protein EVAR_38343_1 [Eumeta japonica]
MTSIINHQQESHLINERQYDFRSSCTVREDGSLAHTEKEKAVLLALFLRQSRHWVMAAHNRSPLSVMVTPWRIFDLHRYPTRRSICSLNGTTARTLRDTTAPRAVIHVGAGPASA